MLWAKPILTKQNVQHEKKIQNENFFKWSFFVEKFTVLKNIFQC